MAHVHQHTVQHYAVRDDDAAAPRSEHAVARNSIYAVLNVVEVLLLFRFLFKLLAANPNAAFTSFLYSLTSPLAAPFNGIFQTRVQNGSIFELSTLVAMIIYALVAYGIIHLFGLHRTVTEQTTVEQTDAVDDDQLP